MIFLLQSHISAEHNIPMLWYKIAITILIGLLVGIERERDKKSSKIFAGVRTYPLIAILGFLAAFVTSFTSYIVYAAIFSVFGLLVIISYYFSSLKGGIGGTSEVTHFLVFLMGSLIFWNYILLASAIVIVVEVFLTFKSEFRAFAGKVDNEDIYAIIKFLIITIIILPLLPNETYGPFDVLNPRKIWYMVVLISGISFVGYILFKLLGANKGIFLLSILGGTASSTATTLSFAGQSKEIPGLSRNLAAGSVLASSVMFPRILFIIFLFNYKFAAELFLPMLIFTLVGAASSYFVWDKKGAQQAHEVNLTNPFKLMFAIKFGLLFGAILFVSAAANHYLGNEGVYYSSVFGGLADLDAMALSMVDMVQKLIPLKVAAVSIIIASTMNTVVKTFIATTLGSKELKKSAIIGFTPILIVTIIYLIFELV
ncbi:hypothetical protein BMS3Abin04_00892 [bacterium BMS3Abin04]|nr:hypothetical protein BMS3Abin04_00892 [bacterium BMS3Abin04]